MSKEHPDMRRLLNRDKQLESTALITSGGHTFVVHRRLLLHDDWNIEMYVVDTPAHEGELLIYRLGQENDGPYGVEHYSASEHPMSTERALWWMHALHATTRLAEELNRRGTAGDRVRA